MTPFVSEMGRAVIQLLALSGWETQWYPNQWRFYYKPEHIELVFSHAFFFQRLSWGAYRFGFWDRLAILPIMRERMRIEDIAWRASQLKRIREAAKKR